MTIRDRLTVEVVLAAFDEYLDRTRGLPSGNSSARQRSSSQKP